MGSGLREVHSGRRCSKTRYASSVDAVQTAFLDHLLRCARTGVLAEALALGVEGVREHPACPRHIYCGCRIDYVDPLVLGSSAAEGLASALLAAGRGRASACHVLRGMPTAQLARVLTEPVLAALGPCILPVISRL